MSTDRVTRFRYTQSDLERRLGLLRDNIVDLRERVRLFTQSRLNQLPIGNVDLAGLKLSIDRWHWGSTHTAIR